MKIAMISYGGLHADPRYSYLADTLTAQGHHVTGINIYHTLQKEALRDKIYLNHESYHIQLYPYSFFRTFYEKFLNDYRTSCKTLRFYMHIQRRIKHTVKHDSVFRKLIKEVDLIHGCEMFFGGFAAYYAAQEFDKPLLFDVKEYYNDMNEDPQHIINWIKKYERRFFQKAFALPCVSQPIIDVYINQHRSTKDKWFLLPNCIPLKDNMKSEDVVIERKGKEVINFILSCTYIPEIRGVEVVIKAWEMLNPCDAKLFLRLVNASEEDKTILTKSAPNTYGQSMFFTETIKWNAIIDENSKYDVGIIPYKPSININYKYCCPNKFSEYLHAGLAILSSNTMNISEQIKKNKLGWIYNPEDIETLIESFETIIRNREVLFGVQKNSLSYVKNGYYWETFVENYLYKIKQITVARVTKKKRVALLHYVNLQEQEAYPRTVLDNLAAFNKYSSHEIDTYYIPSMTDKDISKLNNENYDSIVVHYYAQVYSQFTDQLKSAIKRFGGKKIFFAQDDYDYIDRNRKKYIDCGADVIFSPIVDTPALDLLYPQKFRSKVSVQNCLTGYVETSCILRKVKETKERNIDIFYRGNDVGVAYGALGLEKLTIGMQMKPIALAYDLSEDIEWEISKQIYGEAYLKRFEDSKTTLLTESGSSIVFDDDRMMNIKLEIIELCRTNPAIVNTDGFQEKYKKYLSSDGFHVASAISPKAFEAISRKCVIVAFEGHYSNILEANIHYIPLAKDFSNVEEVIEKIKNDALLQSIANKAYKDIIESGQYSYQSFVSKFDKYV